MSAPRQDFIDFLRVNNLDGRPYLPTNDENDNDSSPFDTLWTEFARSHPRLSPPRSPVLPHSHSSDGMRSAYRSRADRPSSPLVPPPSAIDFRALDYVTDYDTNLMCPICHVPFIDPIVLDCDHTFCMECFETYRNGGSGSDRSRCPACRTYHLGGSRRANRLIRNMASEVRVKCPNSGCEVVTPRSSIEMHATRQCPEEDLPCPISTCTRQTKRKNFLDGTCLHDSYIDCECGASIRLGRGEWIRHKDQHCPLTTGSSSQDLPDTNPTPKNSDSCPGASYGCEFGVTSTGAAVSDQSLTDHISTCTLAKLAPFLQKQANLVKTLQSSLEQQVRRSDTLEAGFERLNEIIANTIQPRLDAINVNSSYGQQQDPTDDTASEIEEIPRSPADLQFTQPRYHHQDDISFSTQHSISNLDQRLTDLESHYHTGLNDLHRSLRDLDARTSLSLMNETLRIREELAHLNGGMYSTRAQVTYLLNHHRITSQQQALNAATRGYSAANSYMSGTNASGSGSGGGGGGGPNSAQASSLSQPATAGPSTIPIAPQNVNIAHTSSTSTSASTTTSPIFGTTRPNLRRGSGGSAGGSRSSLDRVKL